MLLSLDLRINWGWTLILLYLMCKCFALCLLINDKNCYMPIPCGSMLPTFTFNYLINFHELHGKFEMFFMQHLWNLLLLDSGILTTRYIIYNIISVFPSMAKQDLLVPVRMCHVMHEQHMVNSSGFAGYYAVDDELCSSFTFSDGIHVMPLVACLNYQMHKTT